MNFILSFLLVYIYHINCLVLKTNASEYVTIRKAEDFTKLEIEANISNMMQDNPIVEQVVLKFKNIWWQDWTTVFTDGRITKNLYFWIVPWRSCLNTTLLFTFLDRDGTEIIWQHPKVIIGANRTTIESRGYTPGQVKWI